MNTLKAHAPNTKENVHEFFDYIFAPWVKDLGLKDFDVSEGKASATLPQNPKLHWANGAVCGQAIMAAIDTLGAIAMSTTDRQPKGTASQNTQFLNPALDEDLRIDVNVLKFGRSIAYAEVFVRFIDSKKIVAHATLEFVF